MNVEEYLQKADEANKLKEAAEPSFLRTAADAVSTNMIGGNTFVRMVERKHVMTNNEGDDNYYQKDEFMSTIKKERPDISVDEIEQLKEARNPRYLQEMLDNQKRYHASVQRLEDMGAESLPYELVAGVVDPISWMTGTMIFKGAGAGIKTVEALQKGAGKYISNMAQGGITGVGTVGISEATIQAEADVVDKERLNNAMLFAGTLGLGLPLIADVLTHRTAGAARTQVANTLQQGIAATQGGKSLRSMISMSAADQAINDSFSPTLKAEGIKFVTPVTAPRDINGNIMVAPETSMEMVESMVGRELSSVSGNLQKNSKSFGNKREEQGMFDGKEIDSTYNNWEQASRREVANTSDDVLIAEYKALKGIEEMPSETIKREATVKYNERITQIENDYTLQVANLQKDLPDTDLTQAIGRLKSSKTRALNKAQKELDELNIHPLKDAPDDFFDTLVTNRIKRDLDNGKFVVPPHLQYVQDFYVNYANAGRENQLKGIEDKDGRAFNHLEYNFEYMLRNPERAREQLRESLLNDELSKSLIARGFVKEEEITQEVEKMFNLATSKEIVNNFLDDKLGSLSTSPLGRRRLRMDRTLHPELFVQDIEVKLAKYADRMTGRLALKKIHGIDRDGSGSLAVPLNERIKEIGREALANGATEKQAKKDMANAQALYHTVLGTRKYQENAGAFTNTSVRMAKKAASALYGAGFVKWAIVEPVVAVMRYGLKNVVSNYVPAYKVLMDHIKNVDSKDPMVKVLRNAGLAVNTLRAQRFDRLDNYEVTPSVSKAEHWLDTAAHWGRKYSGFNWINDFNDTVAMMSSISHLEEVMVKGNLTASEEAMFARYGLSKDDIVSISKQPVKRDVADNIEDWNLDNWKDNKLSEKFQQFVGKSTRDTIMRADGTRVHRVQSDLSNQIAQLALQFTHMPMALTERTLYNLPDEASAKTVVGMVSGIAFMYAMLSLEDAALVATGARDKPMEYDKLLALAVARTPFAGIIPNVIDTGLAFTGNSTIGSSYAPKQELGAMLGGAGLGVANKVYSTATGLTNGVNETDVANLLKITPIINSIPLLSAYMKGLEHDLKEKGSADTNVDSYQYTNPLQRQ